MDAPPATEAPPPDVSQGGDVPTYRLLDSGVEQTLDCGNGIVSLLGSGNHLTLTGACVQVRVLGSSNQVWVERVASIDVLGSASTVTWQNGPDENGTEPTVAILGADSSVTQGPLP